MSYLVTTIDYLTSQIDPNLIGKPIFIFTRIEPIIEPTIGYQVDFSKKTQSNQLWVQSIYRYINSQWLNWLL
jgi:hypothetical protein